MYDKQLIINDKVLNIEIVNTIEKTSLGLSGRESLCGDCGMLFEFSDLNIRNFHMKDMKFPLDIIWLNKDEIVGIDKNVQITTAEGEINRVKSPEPINMVLEVNAGWTEENMVKVGDLMKYLTN